MSGVPALFRLPETNVLSSEKTPAALEVFDRPPPLDAAVLPLTVQFSSEMAAPVLCRSMAPPLVVAVLLARVQFVSVPVEFHIRMAPPLAPLVFPLKVQAVAVRVPPRLK